METVGTRCEDAARGEAERPGRDVYQPVEPLIDNEGDRVAMIPRLNVKNGESISLSFGISSTEFKKQDQALFPVSGVVFRASATSLQFSLLHTQ